MPISLKQIQDSLLETARRANQQYAQNPLASEQRAASGGALPGEFRNALRDFRIPGADQAKLKALSNEQFAQVYGDIYGNFLGSSVDPQGVTAQILDLITRKPNKRAQIEQDLVNPLRGESPLRSLASNSALNLNSLPSIFSSGDPGFSQLTAFINAFEKHGLLPSGQTVGSALGFLDPSQFSLEGQVANENKQLESDRQRVEGNVSQRTGISTIVKQGADGKWGIYNSRTNDLVEGGFKTFTEAEGRQTQLQGGSAPSLAGRPDIYAVAPTAEELKEGGKPIVPQEGMAPVTPTVATPEQIAQQEAGTLPTPLVESGATYLDGETFKRLMPNLTEDDLIRDGERIYLKPGLTPEVVEARGTSGASGTPVEGQNGVVEDVTGGNEEPVEETEEDKEQARIDALAEGLSDEAKEAAEALADTVVDSNLPYSPDFSEANLDKWFQEGLKVAGESFGQKEKEILGRAREYYIQGLAIESQARELQLRQEELTNKQQMKEAQASLEERGATFSGEANELIGEQSALPPELQTVVEGLLQKQQGIIATSSSQRYSQALKDRTKQAEELLGTEGVKGILGSTPGFSSALLETQTPTPGSLAEQFQADRLTKATEYRNAKIAQELALSKDFPTADLLKYI